jgi:hypothetical protein
MAPYLNKTDYLIDDEPPIAVSTGGLCGRTLFEAEKNVRRRSKDVLFLSILIIAPNPKANAP